MINNSDKCINIAQIMITTQNDIIYDLVSLESIT